MNVGVITASFGGYDTIRPIAAQSHPFELVALCDTESDGVTVWPGARHAHPRLRAKVPKCRPDLYLSSDVNIWIDGSFHVHDPMFVAWCVESLGAADLAMIRHPDRQSIVAEAEVSAPMTKYQGQPVREQAVSYIAAGYQGTAGLWATGLIVSRPTERVRQLGDAWLREQLRWSWQDQVSLPPLLEEFGIVPVELDGPLYPHPLFTIRAHHRED